MTGSLLVVPVLAAPLPEAVPVTTSAEQVLLGSVAQPTTAAEVEQGTTAPVDGVEPTAASLTVTRTDVAPFSLVGVTWAHDPGVTDTVVQVRVQSSAGEWGEWTEVLTETADQGPRTSTGRRLRGGTSPLWTGPSTGVEAELVTRSGAAPVDVQLELVDPGASEADAAVAGPASDGAAPTDSAHAASAQPAIHSRAQWGADERLRTWGPRYASTVKAATLHHTADANGYSADQVPAIMRSIYRYHAVSLGWGDIGYHVVVDRFGGLWEGRSGGLSSSVMGAHAGGFNTATFGVSLLGNHELVEVSQPALDAVVAVIAWKFSLYGVDPQGSTTLVSDGGGTSRYRAGARVTLPTVFGHRDVGATDCPGRYGYARLGAIRTGVAASMAGGVDPTSAVGARYLADPVARAALGPATGAQRAEQGWAWQPFQRGRMYASPETGVHYLVNGNLALYLAHGGPARLGLPLTDELVVPGGGGSYNHFPAASIYWSPSTGSHLVVNAIRAHWIAGGWEQGRLGYPISEEIGSPDGRGIVQHFQGGDVHWSTSTPSVTVAGGLRTAYERAGGPAGRLGYPVSGEEAGTAGRFRQRFTGGDLHWSAATGGHPVVGGLRVAYERLGADAGRLGSPRSAEQSAGDGRGFWQRFEGGDLWWSSRTGGMQVTGGIGAHWQRHGGVTGGLGYPTTDEAGLPDGRGIAQQFEGGAVHWTASTGAHPTVGGIGALWQRHGAAAGLLGYPTTDERALADGRGIVQSYERGAVYWTAQTGAHLVTGAIGALYAQLGAERGSLGYPTEDEAAVDGGIVGRFEGGSILWTPTGGPRVVSR